MIRDRTGEPIEQPTQLDDPKARIRRLLCDDNCDHEHQAEHPDDPTLLDP